MRFIISSRARFARRCEFILYRWAFDEMRLRRYPPSKQQSFSWKIISEFVFNSVRSTLYRVHWPEILGKRLLSNDPGKVDSNFFCYAATVLSPHRNVLIFTQRMHKPT